MSQQAAAVPNSSSPTSSSGSGSSSSSSASGTGAPTSISIMLRGPSTTSRTFFTALPGTLEALLDKARTLFNIPPEHTPFITLGTDERAILLNDSLPFLRDRELLILRWNLDSPSVKRISAAGGLSAQGGARKVRFGADTKEQEKEGARKDSSSTAAGQQSDGSSPRDKGKAAATSNGSPPQIRSRGEKSLSLAGLSSANDQPSSSSAERGSPTMKASGSSSSSSSSEGPAPKLQPSLPLATGAPGSIGYSSANRQAHAHRVLQETRERLVVEEAEVQLQQKLAKEQEESARREAEEKAFREAEEEAARAKEEARRQEEARQEAEDARAEEDARREAEVKARHEQEERARLEAEEKARIEAEEKARVEAEEKARLDAEENARLEVEEKARIDARDAAFKAGEEYAQRVIELENAVTEGKEQEFREALRRAARNPAIESHPRQERERTRSEEQRLQEAGTEDLDTKNKKDQDMCSTSSNAKALTSTAGKDSAAPITRRSVRAKSRKQPQPRPSRASRQTSGPSERVEEHAIIIISSDNEPQEVETQRPLTRGAKKGSHGEPTDSAKKEKAPLRIKLTVIIYTSEDTGVPVLDMEFDKQGADPEQVRELLEGWNALDSQIGARFMDLEDSHGVLIDTVQTSNHDLWTSRTLQDFFERSRISHKTLTELDVHDVVPMENPAVARYLQPSRPATRMPALRRTPSSETTVVPSSSPLAKHHGIYSQQELLKDVSSIEIVGQVDGEDGDEEMAVCAALSSQGSATPSVDPSPSPKKRVRAEEKWSARKRSAPAAAATAEQEAVKEVSSSPNRATGQDANQAETEAVREAYAVASKVIEALRLHPANTTFQQPMSAEYKDFCKQHGQVALDFFVIAEKLRRRAYEDNGRDNQEEGAYVLNSLRLDLNDMFTVAEEFYGIAACTRTLAKFSETYIEEFSRKRGGANPSNAAAGKKEAWDERFKHGRKNGTLPSAPASQPVGGCARALAMRDHLKLQGVNRKQLVPSNTTNNSNSTGANEEAGAGHELKKTAASKSFWDLMPKAAQARMGRLGRQ